MWEILKRSKISTNIIENTLFVLGILEDTGGMSNLGTNWRDANALAELYKIGVSLKMIQGFLHDSFNEAQEGLYKKLISSKKIWKINGNIIHFFEAETESYIDNIDVVIQKIRKTEGISVLFSLIYTKKKGYLIARSTNEKVPVGKVASDFGGGGHDQAASSVLSRDGIDYFRENIKESILKNSRPGITAFDIMHYPVKYISPDSSVSEAHKIILRYGFGGLPVIDSKGMIVGIITQSDISKALIHNLSHAPVRAYMSKEVITVMPDAPLEELEFHIMKNKISRLPVVDKAGNIIGILSRSDVLKSRYAIEWNEGNHFIYHKDDNNTPRNIWKTFDLLPDKILKILKFAGKQADYMGISIFLVGGIVRDLLLGKSNNDIDIVVEGDSILFAKNIAERLNAKLHYFERFRTATLVHEGQSYDFASARVEFYENPGDLPSVEFSSLKNDLYRRDFTINAMAICLNKRRFGDLIDYYGGYSDLDLKTVRILHRLSFLEDPTRILRALRFIGRFDFVLDETTHKMLEIAIKDGVIQNVSSERVSKELRYICRELDFHKMLLFFSKYSILPQLFKGLRFLKKIPDAYLEAMKVINDLGLEINYFQFNILMLTMSLSFSNKLEFLRFFNISKGLLESIDYIGVRNLYLIKRKLGRQKISKLSKIHNIFNNVSKEIILFLYVAAENQYMRKNIISYLEKKSNTNLK